MNTYFSLVFFFIRSVLILYPLPRGFGSGERIAVPQDDLKA